MQRKKELLKEKSGLLLLLESQEEYIEHIRTRLKEVIDEIEKIEKIEELERPP
jgi:hypothetical protein